MVLSVNKMFDSGRGNFLTHCMRKKIMEQKLMCGPQFQPTVSSVHFSLMTPSPKNDTRTYWKTVSSPISWQQVSLYTHIDSCRMEPIHTLQTWFLISCMRRLIFVWCHIGFLNVMMVANCGRLIARILIHAISFYGDSWKRKCSKGGQKM